MVIAAAGIAAAGAIAGGAISASASSNAAEAAAEAQVQAADAAAAEQRRQYDLTRQDLAPWRSAGQAAVQLLFGLTAPGQQFDPKRAFTLGDFQQDPGYAFRVSEGQKALERSAAARGGLLGGRTLRELTRYGQDAGAQEYQAAYSRWNADQERAWNRLASLAGIGQTATTQTGVLGAQAANQISNYQTQAGNARASGYIGQANALNQGLGTGVNALNNLSAYAYLRSLQPATATPAAASTTPMAADWGGVNPYQTSIASAYS